MTQDVSQMSDEELKQAYQQHQTIPTEDVSKLSDAELQDKYQEHNEKNAVPENNPVGNLSLQGGARSPANLEAQRQQRTTEMQDTDPAIAERAVRMGSHGMIPFVGMNNEEITPRNFVGETAKTASLVPGVGWAGGGALQGFGNAIEDDKKSLGGIATETALGAGTGKVLEGSTGLAGDAFNAVTKSIPKQITDTIGDLYNKAIKPSTVKGNANLLAKSQDNVETGVRSIVNNKENLFLGDEEVKLPETVQHNAEAIAQTKDNIFNKYNEMQKSATGKGVTLSTNDIIPELEKMANNKAVQVTSPSTVTYLQGTDGEGGLIGRLKAAGDLSPEEAQDMIKGFNGRLKAYYSNPSPDQYSNTAVDALVANRLRNGLDSAITGAEGEGYQALKSQYGALSSMEKDAARAAQRTSNIQNKGLLDFSDIMTGEQLIGGILRGNPAEVAVGGVGRLIKEYYKKLNSPDANIKNMYSKVSDLMEKEGQPSLSEKFSSAVETAKEKLGGLADMIPGRLGMAGKSGSKAEPVEAELLGGDKFRLPAPESQPSPTSRNGIDPDTRIPQTGLPSPGNVGENPLPMSGNVLKKPLGLPGPGQSGDIITSAKSIRPIMESKYDTPMNKAQSIKDPIQMPKVPTQAEINKVNSLPKSAKDRSDIVRILKKYNIPSLKKFNDINKGLSGAKK